MKKSIYTFLFLNTFFLLPAQSVEFDKNNFLTRKDEFKDAMRKYEAGLIFYTEGRKDFDDFRRSFIMNKKYFPISLFDYRHSGDQSFRNAITPLTDANRFNARSVKLNYMLGFSWFVTSPLSKETIHYLETAYALQDNSGETDVAYWLAWAYHLNSRWDDAIKYYEEHLTHLQKRAKANALAIEDVNKKIAECHSGKTLSAKPERVFVDNLGENVNSHFPEYSPSITADEGTIFFTSRRPNGGKRDVNDNGYFEDVYSSAKEKGKWQAAKSLGKLINTDGHDATAGLSPDGTKLFLYRSTPTDGGDIYQSELLGSEWRTPVHLNKNINTKFREMSVSMSFDGKRLYFISDRQIGGFGGNDIYYCDMDAATGDWGIAKNLGAEINTKYDEEAVFMHPDGKTMYFSSKGYNSMGGYDVFKSTLVNGKWSAPVNLGYPINGPDDDVYFVVSGSGNRAYFASAKPGGFGDHDLYKITFLGPEKSPLLSTQDQLLAMVANPVSDLKTQSAVEVKSAKLTILKGLIYEEGEKKKPLESSIELIDNEKNVVLATFKSNSSTGKYLVTLPSGKNYGLVVKNEGYLFHSENFDLPDSTDFQEFNLDIALKKIEVGSIIILKNIFFDSGKSTIRSESANELARLVKLLKDNPSLKIEISSHTDNIGSDDYNMKLSNERSKSVVDYLIGHSVPATRLVAKGYGETRPVESNDTAEGRQNNRRTEFKILEK
ncbi:MAG: OmpA family protein [Bacteroidetes bacterium]|nr:OmpA family protein [Bacteroidota bacterium]